ncbi:hypothetical protein H0H81_003154 [Sphagnurus paluster]|uniref:CCHC-type domain-containing protein n=1 Tax=Sphagnurus paluster TaxID=117069 RepID=A0A9P7FLW3_9AGAR|nr:hypothetical protein H0H81_003154 [Sphagnurus paluster]
MPPRQDPTAPTLMTASNGIPELARYFEDLEFLFEDCLIQSDAAKKRHTTRYLDTTTAHLWRGLEPSYTAGSYTLWKAAVHALYPGTSEDRIYSIRDLEALVKYQSKHGITNLIQLGEFYRQFLTVSSFLVSRQRLSVGERDRAFRTVFDAQQWTRIYERLTIMNIDHHPADPWPISSIFAAAQYLLYDTTPSIMLSFPPSRTTSSTTPAPTTILHSPPLNPVENLHVPNALHAQEPSVVDTKPFTLENKDIVDVFEQFLTRLEQLQPQDRQRREIKCYFCSGRGHRIQECPQVEPSIRAGKCRRNAAHRIVLPSGARIPNNISGCNLREKFDEYHRFNANTRDDNFGPINGTYGTFFCETRVPRTPSPAAKSDSAQQNKFIEQVLPRLGAHGLANDVPAPVPIAARREHARISAPVRNFKPIDYPDLPTPAVSTRPPPEPKPLTPAPTTKPQMPPTRPIQICTPVRATPALSRVRSAAPSPSVKSSPTAVNPSLSPSSTTSSITVPTPAVPVAHEESRPTRAATIHLPQNSTPLTSRPQTTRTTLPIKVNSTHTLSPTKPSSPSTHASPSPSVTSNPTVVNPTLPPPSFNHSNFQVSVLPLSVTNTPVSHSPLSFATPLLVPAVPSQDVRPAIYFQLATWPPRHSTHPRPRPPLPRTPPLLPHIHAQIPALHQRALLPHLQHRHTLTRPSPPRQIRLGLPPHHPQHLQSLCRPRAPACLHTRRPHHPPAQSSPATTAAAVFATAPSFTMPTEPALCTTAPTTPSTRTTTTTTPAPSRRRNQRTPVPQLATTATTRVIRAPSRARKPSTRAKPTFEEVPVSTATLAPETDAVEEPATAPVKSTAARTPTAAPTPTTSALTTITKPGPATHLEQVSQATPAVSRRHKQMTPTSTPSTPATSTTVKSVHRTATATTLTPAPCRPLHLENVRITTPTFVPKLRTADWIATTAAASTVTLKPTTSAASTIAPLPWQLHRLAPTQCAVEPTKMPAMPTFTPGSPSTRSIGTASEPVTPAAYTVPIPATRRTKKPAEQAHHTTATTTPVPTSAAPVSFTSAPCRPSAVERVTPAPPANNTAIAALSTVPLKPDPPIAHTVEPATPAISSTVALRRPTTAEGPPCPTRGAYTAARARSPVNLRPRLATQHRIPTKPPTQPTPARIRFCKPSTHPKPAFGEETAITTTPAASITATKPKPATDAAVRLIDASETTTLVARPFVVHRRAPATAAAISIITPARSTFENLVTAPWPISAAPATAVAPTFSSRIPRLKSTSARPLDIDGSLSGQCWT